MLVCHGFFCGFYILPCSSDIVLLHCSLRCVNCAKIVNLDGWASIRCWPHRRFRFSCNSYFLVLNPLAALLLCAELETVHSCIVVGALWEVFRVLKQHIATLVHDRVSLIVEGAEYFI